MAAAEASPFVVVLDDDDDDNDDCNARASGRLQALINKMHSTTLSSAVRMPAFGDNTLRTRLFHWSQYSIHEDNAACAAIACVVAMTLLCSTPGSVLNYVPSERAGGGAFTLDEAQLLRCTRDATEWWLQLIAADRVIKTPGASGGDYIMPLQCVRQHPILSAALDYEERYGLFDARIEDVGANNSAMGREFNMTTLGGLFVELSKRTASEPIAAVMTRGASTSCVFVEPTSDAFQRNFWFVDTHRNSAEGVRVPDGTAIVMRFGALSDICAYMERLYGGGVDSEYAQPAITARQMDYTALQRLYNQSHESGERAAVISTQFDALILTRKKALATR